MRYSIVQVGNTKLYVVIDGFTGLRITMFGYPMPPVDEPCARELAKHWENFANKEKG